MGAGVVVLLLVPVALAAGFAAARRHGPPAGLLVAGALLAALGAWYWSGRADQPPQDPPAPAAPARNEFATSAACAECHREQYDSWHRTYHRTMTRDATPEYVKGDFGGVAHDYQGLRTRLTREGDAFFMETVDPGWAVHRAKATSAGRDAGPPRYARFRVDRLVGSHWIQEYLTRQPNGQYVRLPVLYHIRENRWVHSNGGFLAPDSDDFWSQSRGAVWNDTCLYCHNTGPSKNPVREFGAVVGFETEVAELGISCGACHGPAAEHVRRRRERPNDPGPETDVVHPGLLSVPRRDEICARCHGALVPKASAWDAKTHRDPFVPGHELTRYNDFFWSEAEQAILGGARRPGGKPARPDPDDGRFWGDGTPLTTALEYNGMALSACYENGRGKMSCLTCHTAHGGDPDMMLKPRMRTNDACYQCHPDYRGRLAEHTRHPPDSPGSECANCHMPHQVYSLLRTHRSHRIEIPDLAGSVGTGKPHACNQCHLDKSLGWTREQLAKWPNGKRNAAVRLSADEEAISAALLTLAKGDARSRVVVAGMLADPAARKASGTDWYGPFLTRLLEHERYPAVRYLADRGWRAAHGEAVGPFDYLGLPAERSAQLRALRAKFDAAPVRRAAPHLPLTAAGLPDQAVLDRLRAARHDPDVSVHE